MAKHLIHALNFGEDNFGFGLPHATITNSNGFGLITIPNFITKGESDDSDFPCFIITWAELTNMGMGFKSYKINDDTTVYNLDYPGTMGIAPDGVVAIAVRRISNAEGYLHILQAHDHRIKASSNDALDVDVVETVSYKPGNFTANTPTQVSTSTGSVVTGATTQTSSIKQVASVGTGSAVTSVGKVQKTASKVSSSTTSVVGSLTKTDITASKVSTKSHTVAKTITSASTSFVTSITTATDTAIKTLTSTTQAAITSITENKHTVLKSATVTGGSVAELSASCTSGCLTISFTPNTLQTITSTTTSVLSGITPSSTAVLKTVSAASTATLLSGITPNTTSALTSVSVNATETITGISSVSTVTAHSIAESGATVVGSVTSVDVTFDAVGAISTGTIVNSVATSDNTVVTGITTQTGTFTKTVTVTAGTQASYTAPQFTSTTTNLSHNHTITAQTTL